MRVCCLWRDEIRPSGAKISGATAERYIFRTVPITTRTKDETKENQFKSNATLHSFSFAT